MMHAFWNHKINRLSIKNPPYFGLAIVDIQSINLTLILAWDRSILQRKVQ